MGRIKKKDIERWRTTGNTYASKSSGNIDDDENTTEGGICKNNEIVKRKINLVHRLDRGTSDALLFAFADDDTILAEEENIEFQHHSTMEETTKMQLNKNDNNSSTPVWKLLSLSEYQSKVCEKFLQCIF